MKKLLLLIGFISISFAIEIPKNNIVSTTWLQNNQGDKNLVIIDTRPAKEYKKAHIKGAVNYPKGKWFQGKIGNIPKIYNTPKQFEELFSKAGVQDNSTVVFYSAGEKSKDFGDATAAMFVSWLYGFEKTAILNGGFAKWIEEKKPSTKEVPVIKASDFEVENFDKKYLASINDVIQAQYDENIQLADARTLPFFTGKKGRKDLARKGRVPTAKLTPMIRYLKKVDNHYELLSKDEAKKMLNNNNFGLNLDKEAIYYCNTGHKARGMWFISKFLIGMDKIKVYDASMVEYTRTTLPMKTGEASDF